MKKVLLIMILLLIPFQFVFSNTNESKVIELQKRIAKIEKSISYDRISKNFTVIEKAMSYQSDLFGKMLIIVGLVTAIFGVGMPLVTNKYSRESIKKARDLEKELNENFESLKEESKVIKDYVDKLESRLYGAIYHSQGNFLVANNLLIDATENFVKAIIYHHKGEDEKSFKSALNYLINTILNMISPKDYAELETRNHNVAKLLYYLDSVNEFERYNVEISSINSAIEKIKN